MSEKLTFCSGVGTVTGANFLLETSDGAKVLVDCGLVQGEQGVAREINYGAFGYEPASIQALLITHAHLDHVGRIPKLVKEGFKGVIYSTPETRSLAEIVLNDAVGLLAKEAKRENTAPLYGLEDMQAVFPLWKTIPYHESTEILPGVSITLKDAGHILGSSMIQVSIKDIAGDPLSKILFTGDLGNSPHPLLRDTEPAGDIDYMVIESTYGDRNHEQKDERDREFETIVRDALARGGTLVIPAFSLDRAQVLLYELDRLVNEKKIPSVPVYFDSPMAEAATAIYKNSTDLFNDTIQAEIRGGNDIFSFPRLEYVATQNDSRHIDHQPGSKIILAGSGMSVGGRVISHEEQYLPDPKSTILLVGYQSVGSLGRQLADGLKKVRIYDRQIDVRATVKTIYGYSAHKDSDHLVEFVGTAGQTDVTERGKSTTKNRLKEVFVAMGEPGASMHLAQRLHDEFGIQAIMPEKAKPYELL